MPWSHSSPHGTDPRQPPEPPQPLKSCPGERQEPPAPSAQELPPPQHRRAAPLPHGDPVDVEKERGRAATPGAAASLTCHAPRTDGTGGGSAVCWHQALFAQCQAHKKKGEHLGGLLPLALPTYPAKQPNPARCCRQEAARRAQLRPASKQSMAMGAAAPPAWL